MAVTPVAGGALTTSNGTWSHSPTSFSYQWQHSPDGQTWTGVGSNANRYLIAQGDVGCAVRVIVTATNAAQVSASQTSAVTSAVVAVAPGWANGWGTFSSRVTVKMPDESWRPYSDGSFVNKPLPASPTLAANSAALVSTLVNQGDKTVHGMRPSRSADGNEFSNSYFFNAPSDALYTLHCTKSGGNPLEGATVRIPSFARPADGSDAEVTIIDQASGYLWDFSGFPVGGVSGAGGALSVGWAGRTLVSDPGGGSSAYGNSQVRAACVGSMAGVIRAPEMSAAIAGAEPISHCLYGVIHAMSTTLWSYPAFSVGGTGGSPSDPPNGCWFTLDLTTTQIQALAGIHQWHKEVLKAIATYGWYVGDQGSNGFVEFQTEAHETWDAISVTNPWVAISAAHAGDANSGISLVSGTDYSWSFGVVNALESGAFWANHLKVVDPSVLPAVP